MAGNSSDSDTKHYQFAIDSELWATWKDEIPRSKHLDEAIIDLIKKDAGRGRGQE